MAELRVSPEHGDSVLRILPAHLPRSAVVSAFGSCATAWGLKPRSDLDLLIDNLVELPIAVLADLREVLTESDLPFPVDLLDHRDAGVKFLASIEADGLCALRPPAGPA